MPSVEAPKKAGYKFMGYYTGSNGTGIKYYNSDMSSAHNCDFSSNMTLYAYWQEKTFEECEVSPNVYELATPNQLKSLNGQTIQNYTINIMSDINVGTWSGIKNFSGTLNGNGHTISFSNTAIHYGETFGFISVNNGIVKNVHFKPTIKVLGKTSSSQSSKLAYVGGAVGQNNGLMENVVIDKTISNPYMNTSGACSVDIYAHVALWLHLGGIVGFNDGTVLNCTNNASLGGGESMGGIVGINNNNAEINGCVNNGNIYYDFATGANPTVGGIADTIRKGGSIKNCINNASIIWAAKSNSSEENLVYMAQLAGQAETTATLENNKLYGNVEIIKEVMQKLTDKQLQYVVDSAVVIGLQPNSKNQ